MNIANSIAEGMTFHEALDVADGICADNREHSSSWLSDGEFWELYGKRKTAAGASTFAAMDYRTANNVTNDRPLTRIGS